MDKRRGILAAVTMMFFLTACAGKKGVTEPLSAVSETEDCDLYGYAKPISIRVGLNYEAPDLEWYGGETSANNSWMELYREHNIVPGILYEVDSTQNESRLSAAVMSGNPPDIMSIPVSSYRSYVEEGVAADITEAYEKYASDELKDYMETDGGKSLESLFIDGRLYGLPALTDPFSDCRIMFIRQDWLDRLGLSVPETMEELKAVAHAFTYDDPDGNGIDDTYGMILDGVNVVNGDIGDAEPIFNAFGCYLGTDGMAWLEEEDGNIVWGGADAGKMKTALSFLQDMYQDGSLTKDFIFMDSEGIFDEAGSGRCGIWFGPNWAGMNPARDAAKVDRNAHVVSAPVPDGTGQGGTKAYAGSAIEAVYCVSSQCANPEVLIKLWNLSVKYQNPRYVTAEEYNKYYGDSMNYTGWKVSLIYALPPGAGENIFRNLREALDHGDSSHLNTKEMENYTSIMAYLEAVKTENFDPYDPRQQRGVALYSVYGDPHCAWDTICRMKKEHRYVTSAYRGLPSETVTNAIPTLKKLLTENIVKIITGDSVDSYDSFLEAWYSMGGRAALEEVNAGKY